MFILALEKWFRKGVLSHAWALPMVRNQQGSIFFHYLAMAASDPGSTRGSGADLLSECSLQRVVRRKTSPLHSPAQAASQRSTGIKPVRPFPYSCAPEKVCWGDRPRVSLVLNVTWVAGKTQLSLRRPAKGTSFLSDSDEGEIQPLFHETAYHRGHLRGLPSLLGLGPEWRSRFIKRLKVIIQGTFPSFLRNGTLLRLRNAHGPHMVLILLFEGVWKYIDAELYFRSLFLR